MLSRHLSAEIQFWNASHIPKIPGIPQGSVRHFYRSWPLRCWSGWGSWSSGSHSWRPQRRSGPSRSGRWARPRKCYWIQFSLLEPEHRGQSEPPKKAAKYPWSKKVLVLGSYIEPFFNPSKSSGMWQLDVTAGHIHSLAWSMYVDATFGVAVQGWFAKVQSDPWSWAQSWRCYLGFGNGRWVVIVMMAVVVTSSSSSSSSSASSSAYR